MKEGSIQEHLIPIHFPYQTVLSIKVTKARKVKHTVQKHLKT